MDQVHNIRRFNRVSSAKIAVNAINKVVVREFKEINIFPILSLSLLLVEHKSNFEDTNQKHLANQNARCLTIELKIYILIRIKRSLVLVNIQIYYNVVAVEAVKIGILLLLWFIHDKD